MRSSSPTPHYWSPLMSVWVYILKIWYMMDVSVYWFSMLPFDICVLRYVSHVRTMELWIYDIHIIFRYDFVWNMIWEIYWLLYADFIFTFSLLFLYVFCQILPFSTAPAPTETTEIKQSKTKQDLTYAWRWIGLTERWHNKTRHKPNQIKCVTIKTKSKYVRVYLCL